MYKPQPLPQAVRVKPNAKTKSPPSRTRKRKSKLNLYKRKKQKQKQEDEDEEETISNNNNNNNSNDDDLVTVAVVPTTGDVSGEVSGPLSLLRKFPNNSSANSNNLNQLAPATCELYAKMAESLKKLLVSELSLWSRDVETIVASANRAFETLDWHRRTELSPLSARSTLILRDRAPNPPKRRRIRCRQFSSSVKRSSGSIG